MKNIITLLLLLAFYHNSFADSPLTSTNFYKVYNNPTINKFIEANGRINDGLCSLLFKKDTPLEIKIAGINALGWKLTGQNNAEVFLKYLVSKKYYQDKNNFLKNSNAEDLILYTYMLAMDNYVDVSKSVKICEQPIIANNQSKCIRLISALIHSQSLLYSSYCKVYTTIQEVNENKNLRNDIKENAIQEIFKYIDNYKKYCQN